MRELWRRILHISVSVACAYCTFFASANELSAKVIDSFAADGSLSLAVPLGGTNPSSAPPAGFASGTDASVASEFGSTRYASITRTGGNGRITAEVFGGDLLLDIGSNAKGEATLKYSAPAGLLVDFSTAGQFQLDFSFIDLGLDSGIGNALNIVLTLMDAFGDSDTQSDAVTASSATGTTVSFMLSNFSVDLSKIMMLTLLLDPQGSAPDIELAEIRTTNDFEGGVLGSIPEPASLAIWGVLAGVGCVAARRRQRKVADPSRSMSSALP